ncbi:FUSC family protein [Staphylococcus durrellii]|uniref:FUSC family protein n=1 Tax=Staphylococcus durrellii TaxID=2781773 RepID=UPI00189EE23C|nr:FUSC family protein [Staphylococcus durrellii]MBF7016258.1 FUSC family protein [Staphylococcus durrellii]
MINYLKSLVKFDKIKIDPLKGTRQAILMFIPLIIGYLTDQLQLGLLMSTGTLAHVYVFGGSARSKLRIILYTTIGLSIAIILGSLTVTQPLMFGMLLLVVTVVPYFIFSALNIPGPSSTFFIVAFSLPINLPVAPEEALTRGLTMFAGGLFATLVVIVNILIAKESAEFKAVKNDYTIIKQLVEQFNDETAFSSISRKAVSAFKNADHQFITASLPKGKRSIKFQKLLILHNLAQGIHAELLELNSENNRPLDTEIIEMVNYISDMITNKEKNNTMWRKEVDVSPVYQNLIDYIFRVDEIMHANDEKIAREIDIRVPIYGQHMYQNLTLDSIIFKNTLRYIVIMGISIFVALMFHFDKAYWIPLSAHTVLVGRHTMHSLERAGARGVGTVLGVIALSVILISNPSVPVAIALLALTAGITETFVGANYSFAVIFITIQVLLLNGLASQHLTLSIALPRITDVMVGVIIGAIGLVILGRKTASSMLPSSIGEVVRAEAKIFHYLFSANSYAKQEEGKKEMLLLSVKLSNMSRVYDSANGEIFNHKVSIQNYYPTIYALEEISFMLTRALNNSNHMHINDEQMGEYLLVFENIAKHFDHNNYIVIKELSSLPQYVYIKEALMNIQHNCIHTNNVQSHK